MQSALRLVLCGAMLLAPVGTIAQETGPIPPSAAAAEPAGALPDAPVPQFSAAEPSAEVLRDGGFEIAADSSSSPQQTAQQPASNDARKKARQQLDEQKHQRILGILPAFNTSYRMDAVSLTRKEKISLAFHSATDPMSFGTAFVVAGLNEALDDDSGFGWGAEGYFKRTGAAFLDSFDGTMIGNGFLPALLHQDPRYFRLGHGSAKRRLIHAVASAVICKHDNTGKWEPNYSNVGGNIISGAISHYYYPSNDSGIGGIIGHGVIVSVEGTFGSVFREFWPDISRKVFHKDPTNGLDAQQREADEEKKKKEKQPLPPEK
jgi:hypothetical protein